jgi:hypothetical protein
MERTYINIFDDPKRKGIPTNVVEHSTDLEKMRKEFDDAAKDYAHRIGVVVTTEEEFAEYTKPKKRKAPPRSKKQEPSGTGSVPGAGSIPK